MHMKALALTLVTATAALTGNASAHIHVANPPSRHSMDELKYPPCGARKSQSMRAAIPTVYAPGATIALEVDEFVGHTGYFRVAFQADGDAFPQAAASIDQRPLDNGVIAYFDDPDDGEGTRTLTVTLPNVQCENCTLQVIQWMDGRALDFGTETPAGQEQSSSHLYFTCSDIALRGSGIGTGGAANTGGGATGGNTGAPLSTGGTPSSGGNTGAGGLSSSAGGSGGLPTKVGGATSIGGISAASGGSRSSDATNPQTSKQNSGCSASGTHSGSRRYGWLAALLGAALVGRRQLRSAVNLF